jgi:hypothetical protein
MNDLWTDCGSRVEPVELAGEVLRMVESQEQVATQRLVANLGEQDLLESLLERSKPPRPAAADRLEYLLATPFRYPPLRHGSRFGRRHEPSLFYASRGRATLFAEAAYYRFVFWQGMVTPPPKPLRTQHTLFGVRIRAPRAYCLHQPPFDAHQSTLMSPTDYAGTQALGSAMRNHGADALEYRSARDTAGGLNVALYSPAAFAEPRPCFREEWFCETAADRVSFSARGVPGVHTLLPGQFTVNGVLPMPAA